MNSLTDCEIIEQIRMGNANVYSILVDRYKHLVFTSAVRFLKNREDAEEVAQDVFLNAYRALDTFRGDSKVSTWLYRITYNKCLDHCKKNARRKESQSVDISESHNIGVLDKQLEALEQDDRRLLVKRAIGKLTGEDALLVTLFYLEELTLKEISEIMGHSTNTLKVRLFRSRKRLTTLLKHNLGTEIITKYGG